MAKSQILTKLKNSNRFEFLYAKHNSEKNIRGVDELFVFLVHPNVQTISVLPIIINIVFGKQAKFPQNLAIGQTVDSHLGVGDGHR